MDHAINSRQAIIASAKTKQSAVQDAEAAAARMKESHAAKRIRAIRTLGERWVLHPRYDANKCVHHNPMHKGSAVLTAYLHFSGAIAAGRV